MKTAVKVVELKEYRSLFARLVMICKNRPEVVAPLPHRLTWSAIVAEWAPQTALLHGKKELTFLAVVVPRGPGNYDPRERIRTSL